MTLMVRAAARRSKDGPQARRLLALAAVYEGARRTEAAKIGGVTLQIIRDWVMKFISRLEGFIDRKPPSPRLRRTPRRARRDHRAARSRGSSGCALADRRSLPMDFRGVSRCCRQADVEPPIARHGLSQALGRSSPSCSGRSAIEDFKKAFPRASKRSGLRGRRAQRHRGLVRRRGACWPEEQDDPALGHAWRASKRSQRSAHRLGLYFGASVPGRQGRGHGDARCNTEAMNLHFAEIATQIAPGAHAVLLVDPAGWHLSDRLIVPPNIT